ncbi:RHS repeat-associated core domain-containing protein [Winslowiella iniecta]|uniref:RHS repeat-associated core domain-containing protein n=1 Tax=Winslowiella iniecta TaxID=1560201 RepID=A0A0L7TG31_9GAMM|nr:RHS repeat-associated core domain-containing protein [Winslowiella iniecta]KOC88182.1 hypothetical protein NG42_17495 [Winslowiella iniecta]KOC94206.1 hypothetical protein NG43_05905 [Winslowiella iniecta]
MSHYCGFNGQRLDPVGGFYALGHGYRAYNPGIKRFNCPDRLSPFNAGGINPYAYCDGDPINRCDPSGHFSWQAIAGISLGMLGLVGAIFTAGSSLIAVGSITSALAASSTMTLVVGSSALVSDITGIVSLATANHDPRVSTVAGWLSFASGLLSLGAGLVNAGPKLARWLTQPLSSRLDTMLKVGLSGRGATGLLKQQRSWEEIRAFIDSPDNFIHLIFGDDNCEMISTGVHLKSEPAETVFQGIYRPHEWILKDILRANKSVPFYASDVIRYQYERVAAENGFTGKMPGVFILKNVVNSEARALTQGKEGQPLFDAFFQSILGKTTRHVLTQLELEASSVELFRQNHSYDLVVNLLKAGRSEGN